MNNKTMHNYTIKHRGDGVYDLYVDGKWVIAKGSYMSIVDELKVIMEEVYSSNDTE